MLHFLEGTDLLFELRELGLEGRLLEGLGFLVEIDLLGGYEVIERYTWILRNDGVDFLGGSLGGVCQLEIVASPSSQLGSEERPTSFFVTFRT